MRIDSGANVETREIQIYVYFPVGSQDVKDINTVREDEKQKGVTTSTETLIKAVSHRGLKVCHAK